MRRKRVVLLAALVALCALIAGAVWWATMATERFDTKARQPQTNAGPPNAVGKPAQVPTRPRPAKRATDAQPSELTTTVPPESAPSTLAPPTEPSNSAQSPNPSAAVMGGQIPVTGTYPYIVSIRKQGASNYGTGFLIGPSHVLTAQHVVKAVAPIKTAIVRIGSMRRDVGGEERKVTAVYLPGGAQTATAPLLDELSSTDWAILKLNKPSTKTPIKVNGFNATVSNKQINTGEAWAVGFGQFQEQPNQNIIWLRHARVNVGIGFVANKPNGMIVSDSNTEVTGVCSGDSGGPLIVLTQKGPVAVGIVKGHWKSGKDCTSHKSRWVDTRRVEYKLP